ncbi:helix-turn-helix transcriptional regulator [Ralstonia pickettii]|uniref:helix-turn-helix domain-containing protein n=1 Tax=Ralstonia pickettii TaxID=329 RepID=UPI0027152C79|nr:helix-turn-helix transcriptional regulator [Ralstonia pickettii]WKZ85965.1 helix-turn-helix transcriptional regulator [Ralstonia pickettii]
MPIRTPPSIEDTQDAALAARVGAAISERRRALGLTQARLAELIDLEQEAVSRWERGTRVPTLYRLQQLSDALDCTVDALLRRGSRHIDDQSAAVSDALKGLDDDERALVVNFVQQFTELLRSKHTQRRRVK